MQSRIQKGVLWSSIEKFSISGIQFMLNVILARLIVPGEYALIAMISIFIAIGQTFIDSGFSQALIQKLNRTEKDFSTVFYFNIVVAVIIYVCIYLIAPYIAEFYNNNVFIKLTRIIGLNLIISSLAIVQRTKLIINVDFKTLARGSIFSVCVSGFVGIVCAYCNLGVWAMVLQSVLYQILLTSFLFISLKWYPKLLFSFESFRQLFSYGSKLLFSRLLNTVCQNLYSIIIGKYYPSSNVAYYNTANQIAVFPSGHLTDMINRAIFPLQCELQNNIYQLRKIYLTFIRLSTYVIVPIMIGILVLSEPFIKLLLTDKWLDVIPLLQILCLANMLYPIMSSNQMFNVLGRTDIYLKLEIIKKVFFVIILIITLPLGIVMMCWGICIYNIIEIIITIILLKRIFPINFYDIVKSVYPIFLISFSMGFFMYFITTFFEMPIVKLFVGAVSGIFIFISFSILFKFREYKSILSMIKFIKIK